MAKYGAEAKRVPAQAGNNLADIDFFKIGIIGKTERGFDGVVHDSIYSMGDFETKCGLYNTSYYAAYIANSFYKELNSDNNVEMKVLSHVATDAVQASYDILDSDGTPEAIFYAKAGMKGVADESAFGNKIAIKISGSQNISMKLTTDTSATPTTAVLDNVDNLEIGHYLRFYDGTNDETEIITDINRTTKTVTFLAMTNTYTAALTTVYRRDVDLYIAVKSAIGNYELKEEWLNQPIAFSDTIGLTSNMNDPISGSNYLVVTHNSGNATADAADQQPAALTAWTALTSGADGTASVDADWNTVTTTYFNDADVSIIIAPESVSVDHHSNMLDFVNDGWKSMYYVHAANQAIEATLKNFGGQLRKSVNFGIIKSDKWLEIIDPATGNKKPIPKTGVDAAHWFNTFAKFGESKVAAGNKPEMVLNATDRLIDDNGLIHDDKLGVGGRLIRDYSVNICKYTVGKGVTNNSARTLSVDDGYKFENQIMQFLLYKKSILTYLRNIEQDRSGRIAQESHYNAVWSYMLSKYKAGHLYIGQKEDGSETSFADVCMIKNDFSNNTLADIANGIENTLLQFIAPPPVESPILSLASAPVTIIRG
jgi:hypothetical protein